MSWPEVALWAVAVALLIGWWVWVCASRLDRLHRKVVASRAVVDAQLRRRASAASALAASGLLDPVSSVLVGEAAWDALLADGADVEAADGMPAALAAQWTSQAAAPDRSGPTQGAPARTEEPAVGDEPFGDAPAGLADRGEVESALSAALREALGDAEDVARLRAEPGGAELVDTLAESWYRVQLARRFHNEAVAQAQRLRRGRLVRLLRLAGHALVPQTLELDDGWPRALGRPGQPRAERD